MHDADVRLITESGGQAAHEMVISLDSENARAGDGEVPGEGALSGADLQDEIVTTDGAGLDELCGDRRRGKEMRAGGPPGTGCRGHGNSTS
ncbi:hypothetical protein GCM10017786_64680 [Amycolatopsis deserti]|uniref:Uncharacterized protein n=1 Tax=Amycolatopsis deserti TaxID=185696 RepID=A0ABQ3JGU1_9PSEU|nr:hypothetical protein GCM10017786_64680 [Amycolatopsis deserti]